MTENKEINYSTMKGGIGANNQKSARFISKLLVDAIHPHSVLDIGCATGVWLHEFEKLGVERVQGIDGSWVLDWKLEIPRECIEIYDFEDAEHTPKCIGPEQRYDLAICLEMGEHLSAGRADALVDALTTAADVIYFSGATPFSGGIHHVNERWQTYWLHKFERKGYQVVDYVRPKIWYEKDVCYFYAEESFLLVKKERLPEYEKLANYVQEPIYDCIHPEHFVNQIVKPTHDWSYLISMQKRLLWSFWMKWRAEHKGK